MRCCLFSITRVFWLFAARVFFRRIWFWLVFGFVQAYFFALWLLFFGSASMQLMGGTWDALFVSFAYRIHAFYLWSYLASLSNFFIFFVGLFLLSCAFWLHFCVSQMAACVYQGRKIVVMKALIPKSWLQLFQVVGISFIISFVMALGLFFGLFPAILAHFCFFAVFPILVDNPSFSLFQVVRKSCKIARRSWSSIAWFSIEAFMLYIALMYLVAYIFLVVIVPLARYALCRMLVKNLP